MIFAPLKALQQLKWYKILLVVLSCCIFRVDVVALVN